MLTLFFYYSLPSTSAY